MVDTVSLGPEAPSAAPAGGGSAYRVMVVDDSAVIRGFITRALESDSQLEIVASVGNGQQALNMLSRRDVDIIILDIEMPVMDGLTALPLLLKAKPGVKVIIASTLTRRNAAISVRALAAGASDYIPKPETARDLHASDAFRNELIAKIKAIVGARTATKARASAPRRAAPATPTISMRKPSSYRPNVLAIGSSTGGPQALLSVFGSLKKAVAVPIFITQHMPVMFTKILAEHLARTSGAPCAEGRDGEPVTPGRIYIAPGDNHMVAERNGSDVIIRINQDPPENYCRPAVDPMLRSLAAAYGPAVLCVILTGMGCDGLNGGNAVVDAGGTVIAQDEQSSVVWGMPGAVASAGLCSATVSLSAISGQILTRLK